MEKIHRHFMKMAIEEAEKAGQSGEVPVGCVVAAKNGEVLARERNRTIARNDVSAHAEILAIRLAAEKIGNYRLMDTVLYATIEPCIMCMGAIVHARVATVVYGAADPKWGAAGSLYNFGTDDRLNHRVEIITGIRGEECAELMRAFFRARRKPQPGL
jgi:tRNA(adenine34) deaminase